MKYMQTLFKWMAWALNKNKIKIIFYFKDKLGERFDAIAYGIQRTEELLTEWITNGIEQTGIKYSNVWRCCPKYKSQ